MIYLQHMKWNTHVMFQSSVVILQFLHSVEAPSMTERAPFEYGQVGDCVSLPHNLLKY